MTIEEAIKELEQRLSTLKFIGGSYVDCVNGEAIEMAMEALRNPEKQFAKWIEDGYEDWYPTCSYCGYMSQEEFNYCPYCGAKMKEGEQ